MSTKKKERPDPKELNAVIVANNLVKGIYRKPQKGQDTSAEKREKGNKNESDNR